MVELEQRCSLHEVKSLSQEAAVEDEGFSIGVWSSMEGTVTSIERQVIAISRGEEFQEKAEAEAEAEMKR